ncbi:beta-glucosidase 22-like isoform X5 [Phoenix dactylifera]|uniref:Beta-glucosidase 22-like isoform X5 n=1 Tax=Phoenix dactylifera TaxID=42345 RepID=A0A8B9A9A9_PHODC|nr:beta-glucosidase 22-like isoform X5 [Phoenix dactylifera]
MRRGSTVPLLLLLLFASLEVDSSRTAPRYSRDDFSPDFVFGAGTSAYQVEGAAAEDGRSPCIWDTFTHEGKMPDKSTGDVASDGYHKYKEDVKLMTDTGLEAYKFSISWSRLLPNGRGAVNPKGLEFFNNLINELVMQNGWIGLNVYTFWAYAFTNSTADVQAAQRSLDFMIGWIINPLVFGDYPEVMKKNAGSRLPSFNKYQSKQVKGSFDFVGLNHYFSAYVSDNSNGSRTDLRDYNADIFAKFTVSKNITPTDQVLNQLIPVPAPADPQGLEYMLEYLKEAYGNPPIYIQENGYGVGIFNDTIHDTARIDFLSGFIGSTLDAVRNGSDVRGYFVWSFLDVFELLAGYRSRFGLYFVDFDDEKRERVPKLSAFWYSNFLKKKQDMNIERTGLNGTSHAQQ